MQTESFLSRLGSELFPERMKRLIVCGSLIGQMHPTHAHMHVMIENINNMLHLSKDDLAFYLPALLTDRIWHHELELLFGQGTENVDELVENIVAHLPTWLKYSESALRTDITITLTSMFTLH